MVLQGKKTVDAARVPVELLPQPSGPPCHPCSSLCLDRGDAYPPRRPQEAAHLLACGAAPNTTCATRAIGYRQALLALERLRKEEIKDAELPGILVRGRGLNGCEAGAASGNFAGVATMTSAGPP